MASRILFSEVSEPMENSEAGRLLLMVAGMRTFVSPSFGNFSFFLSSSSIPFRNQNGHRQQNEIVKPLHWLVPMVMIPQGLPSHQLGGGYRC